MAWQQAWALFQQVPFLQIGVEGRADWVANGVLYAPLGVLSARLLGAGRGGLARAVLFSFAGVVCASLAFAVEFTQLFFPPRTVSQNDLWAECLGSAAGIVATPLLTPWWNRLHSSWFGDGRRVAQHVLQGYAAAYLLYCFFPYDLLLSAQELQDKARSGAWGWWLATPDGWSWPRALLQWGAEAVLTMPFGWLLLPGGSRHRPERRRLARAALAGALLGVAIEAGQFLIETGISQGASVLSRALGVAAGAWAQRAWSGAGTELLQRWLARHAAGLTVAYLALLTVANGWWTHPGWRPDGFAAAWDQVHLMPFYYHYFTSEAIALASLCSVAAMYLPLAALCWARRVAPGRAALLAGGVAAVIECGKLLLTAAHPDPTNALIAGASCGLLLSLARRWQRRLDGPAAQPTTGGGTPLATPAVDTPLRDLPWRRAWVLPALPAALLGLLLLPLPVPVLLLAFGVVAGSAAAVWWRPALLLAIVPAALPVFDLAPLSGRFFWDEFDWLLAACLAAAWFRTPAPAASAAAAPAPRWRVSTLAFAALGASLAVGTVRGLAPWPGLDANSFSHYYSHFNALRIAKGAVWAWLFVACWRRLARQWPGAAARFGIGIEIGLALTVLTVLWERAAFAGWVDFAADYRVTGPFSAMHKGGAYIECFLAVASAYALAPLLGRGGRSAIAASVVLFAGSAYALMVTFSRNGYAAFAWVVVAAASTAGFRGRRFGWPRRAALLAALLLAAALGAAVLAGPYAQDRLGHVADDLATRQAHWADALAMRDASLATTWFGMGLGRFPETHFWRSREAAHAASFRVERDDADGNTFLRLGSGASVYVEQIVDLPATSRSLTIQARLRSTPAAAGLTVMLCRKWLLTSKDCERGELKASPSTASMPGAGWQPATLTLPALAPSASRWPVPVKLTLITPAAGAMIDLDDIRLLDGDGNEHLANGAFSAGMDRWFFATDVDPPWHIHNLAVAVLFEQGWSGVLAWTALLFTALGCGGRRIWRGDDTEATAVVLPAWIGLGALLISGTLNTLIDAPRFLWLVLVLAWLCTQQRCGGADAPRGAAGASAR